MTTMMKALCCICGSLRTCRRPRNHRQENFWLRGPVDQDWHRETGDLKCSECGRVTNHALLHPEGHWAVDHAEMMQRVATGSRHRRFTEAQRIEVARRYRQGPPRNPRLDHLYWVEEGQAAWDRGERTVLGLCGDPVKLNREPSAARSNPAGENGDQQVVPRPVRDQEYEDAETGLWWTVQDCVDCRRVWHIDLLRRRRRVLTDKLIAFMGDLLDDQKGNPKKIDLGTVNSLIATLEAAQRHMQATSRETAT